MSDKSNQILRILEDVEIVFRRTTFRRQGEVLSEVNQRVVSDAYVLLFASWYDLLTFNGQPVVDLHPRWTKVLSETDVIDVVRTLKAADKVLLSFDKTSVCSYESFKRSLRCTNQSAGRLVAPLKGLVERWCSAEDTNSFSALHQAFVFLSRLNLKDLTDLEDKAMEDYLEVEQRLSSMSYDGEENSLEAEILSKWFPSKRSIFTEDWMPSHGPGSVADSNASLSSKYKNIGTDARIEYLDMRLPEGSTVLPRSRNKFERTSKVIFVPKSVDKLRTISMEPTTLQWYQQGFGRKIVRIIHSHRYLRRRINLYEQELNRDLAWEGSLDGIYSTIDLSAASDSVSYRLVKKWFHGTSLIAPMVCTRSSRTLLPNGEIINIDKFAPMGSNLCFPTETLVFASIIEASIMRSGGSVRASHYRVYGDDLIIETKYVPEVVKRLTQLGFLVNDDKSFTNLNPPFFRESCGGEYLDGTDVTPIRLSRKFSGLEVTRRHPSRIEALIELCNVSYLKLPSVRRWTIKKLSKLPIGYRVRFDSTGETGVFSPTPTNYHLGRLKYHPDFQEYYQNCGCSSTLIGTSNPEDEDIRLYECLRLIDQRTSLVFPEDRVETSISGSRGLKWGRAKTLQPDQDFYAEPIAWKSSLEKGCM